MEGTVFRRDDDLAGRCLSGWVDSGVEVDSSAGYGEEYQV